MAGLPEPVTKETILKKLDAFSANRANLQAALDDLRDAALPLVDVAAKHLALDPAEAGHLVNWFDQRQKEEDQHARSPTQPSVKDKVRKGLIEACELALASGLQISSYWIRPGYIQSVFVEAFFYKEEPEEGVKEEDQYPSVINFNIYTPYPKPVI